MFTCYPATDAELADADGKATKKGFRCRLRVQKWVPDFRACQRNTGTRPGQGSSALRLKGNLDSPYPISSPRA